MRAGTIVQCDYRKEHGHTGCVLPSYHPLAWQGTLRDPQGIKTQEELIQECPWTLDTNRRKDPQETVPVAWCFGHIYWEKIQSLLPIQDEEAKPFQLPEFIYLGINCKDPWWPDIYHVEWVETNPPRFKLRNQQSKIFSTEGIPAFKDLRFLNDPKERKNLALLEEVLLLHQAAA